jgi:hypothetical protein
MSKLRSGDLVEIRPATEIAKTLDADGAIDSLPFMAEMVRFCGRRFRVSRHAMVVCIFGGPHRGFNSDKVFTLEGVRCSGTAHDGCQKACLIFWHEAWLRKIEVGTVTQIDSSGTDQLRDRLASTNGETYRCQATELQKFTHVESRSKRVAGYLRGLRLGNYNLGQMIRSVAITLHWGLHRKLFGIYPRGLETKAPTESLNLQPGEWVEVKRLKSIIETLDQRGRNRGLTFSPDMRLWCGRKLRVRNRLDKMIADDGTGKMKQMRNTVCLEGSTCGCAHMGVGLADCSRCELTYWREIWLQRCESGETA